MKTARGKKELRFRMMCGLADIRSPYIEPTAAPPATQPRPQKKPIVFRARANHSKRKKLLTPVSGLSERSAATAHTFVRKSSRIRRPGWWAWQNGAADTFRKSKARASEAFGLFF